MRGKSDIKFLVSKYHQKITEWRESPTFRFSWEQILREICIVEKIPSNCWPSKEGLRVAWLRTVPKLPSLATLPTNSPESVASIDVMSVTMPQSLPNLATSSTPATLPTNSLATCASARPDQPATELPKRLDPHIASARQALHSRNHEDV